jgi:hypothetical protein
MSGTIEHNILELQEWLETYQSEASTTVVRRTVSALASKAQTKIKDAITESYNIKRSDIKFSQSFGGDGLSAVISGSKRQLSLFKFGPVQTATGVSVTVKKGEQKDIPHAFIKQMIGSNSFSGVFIRANEGGDRVGRYPIKSLYGLSPGSLLGTQWIHDIVDMVVIAEADATFKQKLESIGRSW